MATLDSKLATSGVTEKEAIAATQMAIWTYTNGDRPSTNFYGSGGLSNANKRIKELYDYLVDLSPIGTPLEAEIIVSDPMVIVDAFGNASVEFTYSTDGVNNLDNSPVTLTHKHNLMGPIGCYRSMLFILSTEKGSLTLC